MNARFKALCDELDATRDGNPLRYFRMQFGLVRTERLVYPARTIIYLGPGKLPSFFDGIRFERAKEPDSFGFHTETFNWNSPDAFMVHGDSLSIVSARSRAEEAGWKVETMEGKWPTEFPRFGGDFKTIVEAHFYAPKGEGE